MNKQTFDISIGSQVITLTTGYLAPQATAGVLAKSGNTVVLATVVMGKVDETKDYFPLSVEFADKLYAGGVIKGGKWVKRELNPSDNSILFGRIIDRSVRPLFPADFHHEVQIIVTVLSNDKENDVIVPAFLAASTALSISKIPFNGPVSAIRVAQVDGKPIVGPTSSTLQSSKFDLLVCTGVAGVNMIEASADIVDNQTMLDAITLAKETADQVNQQIQGIVAKIGQEKVKYESYAPSDKLLSEIEKFVSQDLVEFFKNGMDGNHQTAEELIIDKVLEKYQAQIKSEEITKTQLISAVDILVGRYFRQQTLAGQRYDKRQFDEIRPLHLEVGVLPCTHGSALFQRGLTQALTTTTLGPLADKQYLEDSMGETTKRYLHYYSAAPFSTGQTGRFGRPGRREIGHGALAEKALIPVIPSEDDFPYTIVLTSEVMSQNGSSSMASTCGSTLSLLDAGVPIKDKVAGISVGMISDNSGKYILLTDIAGIEDHHGDMDFKITGTKNGITAIQLDIKRPGLTLPMIADTFVASTKARLQILETIEKTMPTPRPQLSPFAPKIKLVKIPEDKIGEVIGSGGKTIKALMVKYAVQIDIDDDGRASISSLDETSIANAAFEIESMVRDINVGEEFDGIVTRVENFGAFIEFLPGREALLHVSEMSGGFLSDPSTIIKVGDPIHVKVSGFNDNHQIKLSAPAFKAAHPGQPRSNNPSRVQFSKFSSPRPHR